MTESIVISWQTVRECGTPQLVRRFATLKVMGSHVRLTNAQTDELSYVVNELRRRNVLDGYQTVTVQ